MRNTVEAWLLMSPDMASISKEIQCGVVRQAQCAALTIKASIGAEFGCPFCELQEEREKVPL